MSGNDLNMRHRLLTKKKKSGLLLPGWDHIPETHFGKTQDTPQGK